MGALSLVRELFGPPSHIYLVACKEQPGAEYLDSSYRAMLGGPREKRKVVHTGSQSTFPPFYRKGLIGVWCYNLRRPLKATFPGYPRDIGARPQYQHEGVFFFLRLSGSRYFQCFSRLASGDHLGIEA
jgi:hypothetical protein